MANVMTHTNRLVAILARTDNELAAGAAVKYLARRFAHGRTLLNESAFCLCTTERKGIESYEIVLYGRCSPEQSFAMHEAAHGFLEGYILVNAAMASI